MPLDVCWGRARDVVTQRLSVFGSTVHAQSLPLETQSGGQTRRGRSPIPRLARRYCVILQGVWRDDPRLVPTIDGVRTVQVRTREWARFWRWARHGLRLVRSWL
ncbi:hypothetical protein LI328DRAFT_140379 [Trichoderma asperelloides]|nr:hypothetical protein LI328DRAFT_140379 [Trichoderma asperelloides]